MGRVVRSGDTTRGLYRPKAVAPPLDGSLNRRSPRVSYPPPHAVATRYAVPSGPTACTEGGGYGWERVGLGGWLRRWATDRLATFPSSFVCLSAHASLSRLTLDPSVVTVHGSLWSSVFRSTPLRVRRLPSVAHMRRKRVEKPSEVRGGTPVKRRRVTAGGWKEPTEPKERNHEISTGKILNHKLCLRLVRLVRYSRRSVLSSLGRYLSRSAPLWSCSRRYHSQPSPILLLGPPFTPVGHSLRPAKRMVSEGWGEEPNQEPDEVRIWEPTKGAGYGFYR